MSIYEFYWDDFRELVEINEDNKEKIEELLNEYRNNNQEDYNTDDWYLFLEEKGYTVRGLSVEYSIYF
jgi:hypothetical protein